MGTLFVSDRSNWMIKAYDTSDLSFLLEVFVDNDGQEHLEYARGLTCYGGILYAVTNYDYLQRYNSVTLAFQDSISGLGIGTLYDVAVDAEHLWIANDTAGLALLARLDLAVEDTSGDTCYHVHASGEHIYTSNLGSYNAVNKYLKADPSESLASFTTPTGYQVTDIAVSGDYVFAVDSLAVYKLNVSDLTLVDSETRTNIFGYGGINIKGIASDDAYLYISASPSEGMESYIAKVLIADLSQVQVITVADTGSIGSLAIALAAPSVTGRPITVRSYWKRFMSRNPNYKGRLMEIYEGQVGMAEEEFSRTWVGKLTNVTTQHGEFTFESTDLLKDLSGIDVPPKLELKLAADLSAVESGQITLTRVEGLGSGAGYIRIKDEIIGYATLNVTTKALQTLTRGAFGTVADEYKSRDKVQAVRYYAAANPWDILLEMLRVDAGIADADIDLDAFALAKRTPGNDKLFRAVLSEPENLDKLFFEITDILDAKAWVGEDLRITIRRNVQNAPGRAYYRMTDGANIVDNSASVDFNEKSRLTRMLIYWHKSVLGKKDDPAAFDRLDIAVDADAEASYGDVVEKKVFCRWIDPITNEEDSAETYVKNLGMRQVRRSRDAQPLIALSLSLRDLGIKTGDFVRLDTDELVKFNGDPITNETFQVVKRELQDDFSLKVSLLRVSTRRLALIAPDGYPNYRDATDVQKEFGFITQDTGLMENEDTGYYIW